MERVGEGRVKAGVFQSPPLLKNPGSAPGDSFFELVMVGNPRFAVVIDINS